MATYATVAEFEAYVEGWTTTNPDALEALLRKAERDVDRLLGPLPPRQDTGLKLDPAADLYPYEREALARAVSAQAYHRHQRGDALTTPERQASKIDGPDFSITYADGGNPATAAALQAGLLSPLLAGELEPLRRLRLTSGRARP